MMRIGGVDITLSRKNIETILSYVPVGPSETCWEWTGSRNSSGYGRYYFSRNSRIHEGLAHRIVHTLLVGKIPDDMVIDHLCHNRICVNPTHHEIVTLAENTRRGNVPRTRCKRGHMYTEENSRVGAKGERFCRACYEEVGRERNRSYYHANKERYKEGQERYWRRKLGLDTEPRCGVLTRHGTICDRVSGHDGRHYPKKN